MNWRGQLGTWSPSAHGKHPPRGYAKFGHPPVLLARIFGAPPGQGTPTSTKETGDALDSVLVVLCLIREV